MNFDAGRVLSERFGKSAETEEERAFCEKVLANGSPADRMELAEFYRDRQTKFSLDLLLRLADDRDTGVQAWALYALSEYRDERIYPVAVKKLDHPNFLVRGYAVEALAEDPRFTEQNVLDFLGRERRSFCKITAFSALIGMGHPQYNDDLLQFLRASDPRRRRQALIRLWELLDQGKGDLPLYYRAVVRAIGREPSAELLLIMGEFLMELEEKHLLGKKRPRFQKLDWFYPPHFWTEAEGVTGREVKRRLRFFKKAYGEDVPEAYRPELGDLRAALSRPAKAPQKKEPEMVCQVLDQRFGEDLDSPECQAFCEKTAKSGATFDRMDLADYFLDHHTAFALDLLLRLAEDRDKMVQVCALSSLEDYEDPRIYEVAVKKLTHPYYMVRGYALDAIVKYPQFTKQDALDFLQKERHAFGKVTACSALIRLGCPEYNKELLKFLKHPSPSRRENVINTLFNLFDRGEGDLPLYYKTVAQRMAEETSAAVLLSMGQFLMEVEEACLLGRKRPPFERLNWGYPEHFWAKNCRCATKEEAKSRLRYLKKVYKDEYPKACLAEYEDLQLALQHFREHSDMEDMRELENEGNVWEKIGGAKLFNIRYSDE